ncbi:hypothetical protein ACFL59_07945 [Planctomycetota bacterium]
MRATSSWSCLGAVTFVLGLLTATVASAEDLLVMDWEQQSTVGSQTTFTLIGGPGISGTLSQTGGGPADWGVHITAWFGAYFPTLEVVIESGNFFTLDTIGYNQYHNHNSGYPTYPSYNAQLQVDLGTGFQDLGDPLLLSTATSATYATHDLGGLVLGEGTYQFRWVPRDLAFGTNTGTEWFAMNTFTVSGTGPAVPEPANGLPLLLTSALVLASALLLTRRRRSA